MLGLRTSRATVILLAVVAGCTIDTVESADEVTDGALGSACDEDEGEDACDDGLVCPAGGHLEGRCAATCDEDAECSIQAGEAFYCLEGVCTRVCRDTCSLGATTESCRTGERCVPQTEIAAGATACLSWCVP